MTKSNLTVRKGKETSKGKLTAPTHAEIPHNLKDNPYLTPRSSKPRARFWNKSQQQRYTQNYSGRKVFHHRHVNWVVANSIADMDLTTRYKELGIFSFCSSHSDWTWEIPLIRQFYATLFVDPGRESIDFMIGCQNYSLSKAKIAEALEIGSFTGSKLHSADVGNVSELYDVMNSSAKHSFGCKKDDGIIQRINTHTILPKLGNRDSCPEIALRLIHHIHLGKGFDIADLLLGVMRDTTLQMNRSLPYAPFIMQILRKSNIIPASKKGPFTTKVYTPLIRRTPVQQDEHQEDIVAAITALRTLMEQKIAKVDSQLKSLESYKTPIPPSSLLPMEKDKHQQRQILPVIRSLTTWVEEQLTDVNSRLGGLKRSYANGSRIVVYQRKRLRSNHSKVQNAATSANSSDH